MLGRSISQNISLLFIEILVQDLSGLRKWRKQHESIGFIMAWLSYEISFLGGLSLSASVIRGSLSSTSGSDDCICDNSDKSKMSDDPWVFSNVYQAFGELLSKSSKIDREKDQIEQELNGYM